MPEITINMAAGRSQEQKTQLMTDITNSFVKVLGVDPSAVVVAIIETPKNHKMKGGVLFTDR